ncbi:EAL domain-containing protein [Lichenihabitans psoromatis]|uniref:EAL domain-containing protein n=1 Tax=Lichenihabitans psoromatis TaxID=2528642 RepID=UPI001035F3A4|nr:EAL domain-containing protein [Lichenihabitans psoromatis]
MYGSSGLLFAPSGSVLFIEGDCASTAYLIVRGRVELFIVRAGRKQVVAERQAGDIFGEVALVDEGPRAISAISADDCELLVVTREQISTRIAEADPVLRLCLGILLERLRGTVSSASDAFAVPSAWADHFVAAREILSLDVQLHRAIERNELELFFQPIVRLATRQLAGLEVLLRWHHPQRGLLQPCDFIPLAEASGVITAVTTYCLQKVARQFPSLMAAGLSNAGAVEPLFVSVNVSAADLHQDRFASRAVSILCSAGVDPRHVKLEVTESVLIKDAERCVRTLDQCRDHGLQIAIDDFGTGYSSLNYLNTLPMDILKIDRTFAGSLMSDTAGRKIIGAVVSLGAELDLTVVAEGVEEEAQADMLTAMGCELGQGFLFGRPRNLLETLRLIRRWRANVPDLVEEWPEARRA